VQPAELRRPPRTGCPAQGGGNGAADRGQPQLHRERRFPHAGGPPRRTRPPVLPAHRWFGAQSGVSDIRLGGILSLLKVQCTKTLEFCARCGPRSFQPRASRAERPRPQRGLADLWRRRVRARRHWRARGAHLPRGARQRRTSLPARVPHAWGLGVRCASMRLAAARRRLCWTWRCAWRVCEAAAAARHGRPLSANAILLQVQ
jgi:hypothetical protein